jgi:hypothetical protein
MPEVGCLLIPKKLRQQGVKDMLRISGAHERHAFRQIAQKTYGRAWHDLAESSGAG